MKTLVVLNAVIHITHGFTCPSSSSGLGSPANCWQRSADGRRMAAKPSAIRVASSSVQDAVTATELERKYSVLTEQVDSMYVFSVAHCE